MPHEIDRILRAFGARRWFIDPRKGDEIAALLALRASGLTDGYEAAPHPAISRAGAVAVVPLIGSIVPRGRRVINSSGATSVEAFAEMFRSVANDPKIEAIVLEIDSPGGQVDQIPEAAAMVRKARRAGRPIIAVANTLAASAAYWIASQADELVVTPSGEVGSIGVYTVHQDMSERLAADGVRVTMISEGARKVEGNPFGPLDDAAHAAIQSSVRTMYDMFTADVARARRVPVARVRADPESTERHFGGGRALDAAAAVRLGMADRVATLAETIDRLRGEGRRRRR